MTFTKGCHRRASGLGLVAATILLSLFAPSIARPAAKLADYCPPEPATGQLTFKSVDSANSACTPGLSDDVGQAVFQCWQQFVIEVNGCQVAVRTTADQLVGPGRLPCRMFGMLGNLTGEEGIEAQMWAEVDGPALLSYYYMEPEAVAALRYANSRLLVKGIWAYMRLLTGDLRFDDVSWIDQWYDHLEQPHQQGQLQEQEQLLKGGRQAGVGEEEEGGEEEERPQWRRRQQLASAANLAVEGEGRVSLRPWPEGRSWVSWPWPWSTSSSSRRERHGPMRVYRSSETRMVVKVPTGCKYRYTVNPDSHVFDSPARHHAHVAWRTILLTVAGLSCLLAVVGLGTCTYFSRRHAEYVASYWEYQAVKDQLGSELPPSTYVRLFGEEPKSAAAAATATAAALAAVRGAGVTAAAGITSPAPPPVAASPAALPRAATLAPAAAGPATAEGCV